MKAANAVKPRKLKAPPPRRPRVAYEGDAFRLELDLSPQPKQRARHSARGGFVRTYTPTATRQFEAAVKEEAAAAMARSGRAPFECPLDVELLFRFDGDPMAWPTAQRDGDLDNLAKAVLDGLNKTAYVDDSFIVRTVSAKVCAPVAGITVTVRPAPA